MASRWGALFDWDGVIIDSAAQHEESWNRLARREHLTLPDGHFKKGFGMKNEYIIPELLRWTQDPAEIRRLSDLKEALYREIVQEAGIEPLPGVETWLDALLLAGVPCAIGSSTPRLNLTCVLQRLNWESRFVALVSAEDVDRGKPAPDVFLLAAERLGIPATRCVVFEDTPVGIEAGRSAGTRVIGVSTTHPPHHLSQADRVVRRLDDLRLEEISRWFQTG